jgi:iron complex outermembrane receptor protein
MKKCKLRILKPSWFLQLLFSILFSSSLAAQNISGTVTSAGDNAPLPGASVVVKGTTNGTQTDFDGNYNLENVPSNATLVFGYIGFLTQEQPLNGRTNLNVSLAEDTQALEEVVVIGYGSVKKSDLTGAVTSLKAEDLNAGANVSLEQSLQGRAAGVQIYQKSGEPGSAMSVNIRGASSIDA